MFKRYQRVLSRIIESPGVLLARFKGIYSDHYLCCVTAKKLLNQPPKTIIDVGANKGVFIDACNYIFSDCKIYAFEPIPWLYNSIKNKKNTTAFNFGLWDKKGENIMYCNKTNIGASSFLEPTQKYKEEKGSEKDLFKIKAKKQRFDKLNINIERPCFVKIDVEGAEEKVLKGFGDRLNEVDIIQIEWFFKDFHKDQMKLGKLLPFLEKYGFTGFIQREVNFIKGKPSTCDLIFFKG